MAARALIGYLVGYEGTNIFRIWIPLRRKVIQTRDVTFTVRRSSIYEPLQPFQNELLTEATPWRQITVEIPHYTPERNASSSQDIKDSESESETDTISNVCLESVRAKEIRNI